MKCITQKVSLSDNEMTENVYSDNDEGHNLVSSTSEVGEIDGTAQKIKSDFTYDDYGNILTSSYGAESPLAEEQRKITSQFTYTNSGNYVDSSEDAREKTSTFTFNETNGNLMSTTDPKQNTVNYTYDSGNRLLTETCGALQNTYSYTKGVLSEVSHKVTDTASTAYSFVRNIFGNISEVKVGSRTLSKNTYDAGNGLIRQTKYGNEQTVNYDYNSQGRLVKKSFGYGKTDKFGFVTYSYDSRDRLSETYDSVNNLTSKFEYDKYGRFIRASRSDGISSAVSYDKFTNLIDKSVSKVFGITQTLENTFKKSGMLKSTKITTGGISIWSKNDHDELGRNVTSEATNSDETAGVQHKITYLDTENSTTKTTNLLSAVELKKKVSGVWTSLGKKFNYAYDALGNILDITDVNNATIAHYEYDNLNQLARENNTEINRTVTYTYDCGGNIQEKKIYAYTTGDLTLETPESTVVYEYSDSNWKDKLTAYNGENIIYDGIGNPLEYKGWELEWARGRRLDKMSNPGYNVNISFKYDENGIRTQKTVGDVQTDFITSGIKVLAQKTGENTIIWQTDANGNTVGFTYNGTQYFYLKNAQNDIVGSGNIVANYTYDSWGKLISITDSNGAEKTTDTSFIGYINPIRYRGYYYDSETSLM